MSKPKLLQKVEVDFVLFATVLLLVAIGVIMIYSASSYSALNSSMYNYDDMYFLKKQGLWAIVSIAILLIVEKIDYHKLKKITLKLVIVTIVLLLVVLAFPPINGAYRWIRIGPFGNLQPSEIAKYVIVIVLAKAIEKNGDKIKRFFPNFVAYLLIAALFAGLVYIEKNLSIAAVIMVVSLVVMFVGGAKLKHIFSIFAAMIPVGWFFITAESYRYKRFMTFTNPWKDSQGVGYQLCQSLLALGSGGIKGLGFGQSRQKCYYIPEPYNDFIFSIIGEELGLIGCIFIIILFIILIQRGIKIAMNAKDTYGMLLAVGITTVIAVQAIINIAVVTGSIPVTGVPLPFISYGGSSLLFNLIAMGVLLNISSQNNK